MSYIVLERFGAFLKIWYVIFDDFSVPWVHFWIQNHFMIHASHPQKHCLGRLQTVFPVVIQREAGKTLFFKVQKVHLNTLKIDEKQGQKSTKNAIFDETCFGHNFLVLGLYD